MTYEETIEYLYKHLPMFSRIGVAAYKKDLHNTIELCSWLGDPQKKFKSIHIAGTNGKGSTSHMLAAVLQQAGYKTGLYTSPHIKDFRERIRVNGKMVDKGFVVDFVEKTKAITEKVQPSFFELTVAMAFEHFAAEKVDVAVIETGLGGRLDSTNIITPVLSVITNIGYDHMNLLGNTLESIAFEKAGIIKNNIPVVIGESLPETAPVFEQKAKEMNADIYFTQNRFISQHVQPSAASLSCDILDRLTNSKEKYVIDLAGLYQSKNLCTVLHSIQILNNVGFNIPAETSRNALQSVRALTGLAGRWEIIQTNPVIILDVAHNEDGIKQVLEQLKLNYRFSHIHFVLGFVNDKDISKILGLFPKTASYYFSNAHIPRAMPYESLQASAAEYGLHGKGFDDVNDAVSAAKANSYAADAFNKDVIMVCGSFFIIAEVNV